MIYKLIQWLKENKESIRVILFLILVFATFMICLMAIINVGFWDSIMFLSIVGTLMGFLLKLVVNRICNGLV